MLRPFPVRPLRLAALLAASGIVLAFSRPAAATERRFTYTYQSATLGAGQRELEPWTTFRMGRDNFYNRVDNRVEVEFGVTNRLQTSWYLNLSGITERVGPDALGNYSRESHVEHGGISWELKYKLLDPVADALGMALYFEATGGPAEAELEGKLIFDKQIGNLLLAFNVFGEQEWEFEGPETEAELSLEAVGGLAYFLTPAFTLGFEVRDHNVIGHGDKDWESSALFAGPVVSYAWETWWATLTVLPQLRNLKREEGTGNLELEDHEKVNARLIFGTHF